MHAYSRLIARRVWAITIASHGPRLECEKRCKIFPRDWHTLANFQPVLMKIYYTTGLKELAIATGYRGEILTALSKCSNFKRTHTFLLQVWKAMYRHASFCKDQPAYHDAFADQSTICTGDIDFFTTIEPMVSNTASAFRLFIEKISTQDDTWKFLCQFIFKDCLSYVALFTAI